MAKVQGDWNIIKANELDNAIWRALESTYVAELAERTPYKTGWTASRWFSQKLGGFNYLIYNDNGDIVVFLDEGTQPHKITPNTKKMLKFPLKEKPKFTNPKYASQFSKHKKIFFFGKGSKTPVLGYVQEGGKYYCFAKEVMHPGFEGTKFVDSVVDSDTVFNAFKTKVEAAIK